MHRSLPSRLSRHVTPSVVSLLLAWLHGPTSLSLPGERECAQLHCTDERQRHIHMGEWRARAAGQRVPSRPALTPKAGLAPRPACAVCRGRCAPVFLSQQPAAQVLIRASMDSMSQHLSKQSCARNHFQVVLSPRFIQGMTHALKHISTEWHQRCMTAWLVNSYFQT